MYGDALEDDGHGGPEGEDDEENERGYEEGAPVGAVCEAEEEEADGELDERVGEDDEDGVDVEVFEEGGHVCVS